jgi:hypothetical protein
MIKTFEVVPTAANARKMVRMANIMNLTIDPVINELAELDKFDVEAFITNLPAHIKKQASLPRCDFVTYAHDWDYRCIVTTPTQIETFNAMFLAAYASGARPIVFAVTPDGDRIRSVTNFLRDRDIPFQFVEKDFHEVTEEVLVVPTPNLKHNVLRQVRKGVLIHQVIEPMQMAFGETQSRLLPLAIEFPKCIFGITMNQVSRTSSSFFNTHAKNINWWETYNFVNAFNALFPNSTMIKAFNTDHGGTDNNLLRAGFMLRSPEHFAKITNIYTDLLRTENQIF